MTFLDAALMSFINFEHISQLVLVFLMLAVNRQMFDVVTVSLFCFNIQWEKK